MGSKYMEIYKYKNSKDTNTIIRNAKLQELQEKDKPQSGWRGGDGDKPEVH